MLEGFRKMFSGFRDEEKPATPDNKGLAKLAQRVEMMMHEDKVSKPLPAAELLEGPLRTPSKDRILLKAKKKDDSSGPSGELRRFVDSYRIDVSADSETLPGERRLAGERRLDSDSAESGSSPRPLH